MNNDAAKKYYDSINSFDDLNRLINEGEAESLFLECKSPLQPTLNRDLQIKLARALSGFSNTSGGVIIWGVSTTKKDNGSLDVLTQIEPIGPAYRFSQEVLNKIPTLTTPLVSRCENKIIKEKDADTRGVILTYIPQTSSDPVQSNLDDHFYFRSGDNFVLTPYQMLKRLFASTESPDLYTHIPIALANKEQDNRWEIKIGIRNLSSAVGENVKINIQIDNPDDFKIESSSGFRDVSSFNPGNKIFNSQLTGVVHRGINVLAGSLYVSMLNEVKELQLTVEVYSNKMRARRQKYSINFTNDKPVVVVNKEDFVY